MASKKSYKARILAPHYGKLVFSGTLAQLLSTYEARRIGRIHAAGALSILHPSPYYTRLEHSIGVAYLIRELCKKLHVATEERKLAQTAAILHDIGHPAFSYSTENYLESLQGKNHKDLTADMILDKVDLRSAKLRETTESISALLKREGLEPEVIAAIAVKRGTYNGPLYLQDMLNQPFDLDVLDTNARWSNMGLTKVRINALRMLRAYNVFDGRLVFNGRYLNDVNSIISARRAFLLERRLAERARSEVAHFMLRKAIDSALAVSILDKDFVFMDDWQLLHRLRTCKPANMIVEKMLMGQPYACVDIRKIDAKLYKQLNEQIIQLESEIAEETSSKTIDVIIRTKLYHLPEAVNPVLIDERLIPVSQLVDAAKEKFEGHFLFVYHSSPPKGITNTVERCIQRHV